jgi:hypothetical protein
MSVQDQLAISLAAALAKMNNLKAWLVAYTVAESPLFLSFAPRVLRDRIVWEEYKGLKVLKE